MAKGKQIVLKLEGRRKRVQPRTEKNLARLEASRQRLKSDKRFTDNTRKGVNNGNPEGHNQYTHPQGHKNISNAIVVYTNDKVPERLRHLVTAVGLDPAKCTFADVIAMKQLVLACEGSLASAQYVQDNAEDKLKGPTGGGMNPPIMLIKFKKPE